MRVSDDLLAFYQRELVYLRDQGGEFARKYPQVASRLALSDAESPDPHTERLIQAQAFLAARVHRDLEREFPQFAASLLEHICPSLAHPVPSMSVAELRLDPSQGKVTAGFRVPRHTSLLARSSAGLPCRMRTAWDSVLWPLQVVETRLLDGRQFSIRLRCDEGNDLAELELDALRLHLHGEWTHTMPLYDLLVSGVSGIHILTTDGQHHRLATRHWREMGFADGEQVLPQPAHAAPAYVLLQEYFAFPRKFLFFELSGLRNRLGRGREVELRLDLAADAPLPRQVDSVALRTGCVPIINLFKRTSEPLRIDQRQHEYLLLADRQRESSTEIHSIQAVHAWDAENERSEHVPPFGAFDPDATHAKGVFWAARREPSLRPDTPGADIWLAFVDPGHKAHPPRQPIVHANLLCTNRRLAEQLMPGTLLQPENLPGSLHVRCLYQPSPQRAAPLAAQAMWQLVTLLRLNHGSLVDGSHDAAALRAMLMLFSEQGSRDLTQIRGLRALHARPGTAHIGRDAWRGYCRGTDVSVEFDEAAFAGGSPLLLSAVLARFFALYTTVNTFVRLSVMRRGEVWKQWPPMTGQQTLL